MEDADTKMISVVIPVYKSEEILTELCCRLQKVFDSIRINYEIILVNDCSPDNSWKVMDRISKENANIKAILLRKNVGYDCAVMAGLTFAKGMNVVVMDDDLQHGPEDIPKLIEEMNKGYDVVYANFTKKKQSLMKNIGSWLNGKVAEAVINKPSRIYLSPFKILRIEVVHEIIKYQGPFPYVDGLIFKVTSSIGQVLIPHYSRYAGTGNHNLYRSMKIWFNLTMGFSTLPLYLMTFVGLFMFVSAFSISIALILWRIFWGGEQPEGWTTIILVVTIIGGMQIAAIGIIGQYIARIFLNITHRVQFAIKQMNNIDN